jgi:nitroimidazol reductase NimA-like FMN-containing flavoprotein (pyridoxamine 5'-phosphate oxidase superfamily)
MSQRSALRMSADEVDAHLRAGSICRVATHDAVGWPHVVPVAYVVLDGAIAFWADPESRKVVNLRRDPRVTCIVDEGTDMTDLRGVMVRGIAEVLDDRATSERVAGLFLDKVPEEYRDHARPRIVGLIDVRIVVVVNPSDVVSWDHRKVDGVAPQDIGR